MSRRTVEFQKQKTFNGVDYIVDIVTEVEIDGHDVLVDVLPEDITLWDDDDNKVPIANVGEKQVLEWANDYVQDAYYIDMVGSQIDRIYDSIKERN